MKRLQKSTTLWLQGGLGNQLFQWNAGEHIARRAGSQLLVSAASFYRDKLRNLSLAELKRSITLTSAWENLLIGPPYHRNGVLRSRLGPLGLGITQDITEHHRPGQVIIGFFQDAPSLELDTAAVVQSLRLARQRLLLSSLAQKVAGKPIAHVRRGDYASSPAALKTFGSIRSGFYHEAFEALGTKAKDSVFFTDDPKYVIETFGVEPHSVLGPGDSGSDLDSILYMSLGSSLVIPNSTFSWWAAETAGKDTPIVAPKEWFLDERRGFTLARDHWQKLRN